MGSVEQSARSMIHRTGIEVRPGVRVKEGNISYMKLKFALSDDLIKEL